MTNQVDFCVGRKLRRLRTLARFSTAELAAEINIETDELEMIERGMCRAGSDLLERTSRFFGVPVWAFFDDGDENEGADGLVRTIH